MNKRAIVIVTVLFVLFIVGTVSVFADNDEYEYTVTVYYNRTAANGKVLLESVTYTFFAASAAEAQQAATARCEREKGNAASCGGAIAAGRKKK